MVRGPDTVYGMRYSATTQFVSTAALHLRQVLYCFSFRYERELIIGEGNWLCRYEIRQINDYLVGESLRCLRYHLVQLQ